MQYMQSFALMLFVAVVSALRLNCKQFVFVILIVLLHPSVSSKHSW